MKFKINLKIFFVIFLFVLLKKIEVYILFMIFVIIHEMFHLLTGIILGYKVKILKLEIIGMSMEFYEKEQKIRTNLNCKNIQSKSKSHKTKKLNFVKFKESNKDNIKKIIILFMGPISNLIIASVFAILEMPVLVYINIIIVIFNLLPISPLDGGQILNRILRIIFGNKEAYTITNSLNTIIMSVITAISSILILYLKNISIVIILIFMWYLVFKENQKYNEIQKYFKCVHKLDKKSNYNI